MTGKKGKNREGGDKKTHFLFLFLFLFLFFFCLKEIFPLFMNGSFLQVSGAGRVVIIGLR